MRRAVFLFALVSCQPGGCDGEDEARRAVADLTASDPADVSCVYAGHSNFWCQAAGRDFTCDTHPDVQCVEGRPCSGGHR